jgi:hypothetical protein
MANLKGNQKKLDANKDGKISGEDFKLLQDLEKRNPKFLGGLIKKVKAGLVNKSGGTGSEDAQMFLSPLPSYPNQLEVDRQMFALGGFFSKFAKRLVNEVKEGVVLPKSDSVKQLKELGFSDERIKEVLDEFEVMSGVEGFDSSIDDFIKYAKMELRGGQDVGMDISRSQEMAAERLARKQLREEGETDISPDITRRRMRKLLKEGKVREGKAEGGAMDDQMNALAISVAPAKVEAKEMPMEEEPMLPDEEMEEDYVDYVVEETLATEDKMYLNAALEKDAKLSEIFDQVVESATEFTGSGTVEGPGTGRSDSIPARLSDGEFVFTAKATEEIGADNLMSMMKEAEAAADGRQDMANGGPVEEEDTVYKPQPEPQQQDIRVTKETVGGQAGLREEEDLVGDELKKSMLSTRPYVRS